MNAGTARLSSYSLWAYIAAAAIRTAFGLVWAIDAYLKWQPAFVANYLSYITGIVNGQPQWLLPWFNFWVNVIQPAPNLFGWLTRIIETGIALGLLFGLGRKWIYILGGIFALFIWSIPEGFGGPYEAGATDVGPGLVYFLVFVALLALNHILGRSPYSVDFYLEKIWSGWKHIAESAPSQVLEQEPPYLRWRTQSLVIAGIVILLAILLAVISSEIRAAGTQAEASYLNQAAPLMHFLISQGRHP